MEEIQYLNVLGSACEWIVIIWCWAFPPLFLPVETICWFELLWLCYVKILHISIKYCFGLASYDLRLWLWKAVEFNAHVLLNPKQRLECAWKLHGSGLEDLKRCRRMQHPPHGAVSSHTHTAGLTLTPCTVDAGLFEGVRPRSQQQYKLTWACCLSLLTALLVLNLTKLFLTLVSILLGLIFGFTVCDTEMLVLDAWAALSLFLQRMWELKVSCCF